MSTNQIRVVPAPDAGWESVEAVLMTDASARNCWCQFHILENRAWQDTTRDARHEVLRDQIATLNPPRGLVALNGDEPVGWCGVEPRTRLAHVLASRLVTGHSWYKPDDPDVWSIYCILVPARLRRQGIASRLLNSAVEHARRHRAHAIEGYPIDTSKRDGHLPPGFSTGTLSMFEREGFHALASLPSGRTIVSCDV